LRPKRTQKEKEILLRESDRDVPFQKRKEKKRKEKHDVDISNPVKENVRLCIFLAAIRETLSCVDERFKVGESKGKKREENS